MFGEKLDIKLTKRVVLFTTVGRTDLQLLIEKDGVKMAAEIEPSQTRSFHDYLLADRANKPYGIHSGNYEKYKENATWDETNKTLSIKGARIPADTRILLVPAKHMDVAKVMKQRALKVISVVVFNTNRNKDIGGFYNKEPIAAGPIIAEYLADEFGLELNENNEIKAGCSCWQNYLTGNMDFAGRERDYPVNRACMRNIETAIKAARRELGDNSMACLCLGGGMPLLKHQIYACAGLHFGENKTILEFPERSDPIKDPWWTDKQIIMPSDSYYARQNALKLLDSGNFAGAYAACQYLQDDSQERAWIHKLKLAAQLFTGQIISRHHHDLPDYLKTATDQTIPLTLNIGLRIESALNMKHYREAMVWTISFYEAAYLDLLRNKLKCNKVDYDHAILHLSSDQIAELRQSHPELFESLPTKSSKRKYKSCLEELKKNKNRIKLYLDHDTKEPLKKYLNSQALENLGKTIYERKPGKKSKETPSLYRNIGVHPTISPQKLAKAISVFRDSGLWSQSDNPITGECFLDQALVRTLFDELNVSNARAVYCDIVDGLKRDLLEYVMK